MHVLSCSVHPAKGAKPAGLAAAKTGVRYVVCFGVGYAKPVWKTQGSQLGMIAVLHTWGQNLSLHPHLHCIVPGGGIDDKGSWKRQWRSDKYLFAVKALSKVFRAKYVQQLRSNGIDDKSLSESLFAKQWVVYAKRPFGGPQQVIEYLGRYT